MAANTGNVGCGGGGGGQVVSNVRAEMGGGWTRRYHTLTVQQAGIQSQDKLRSN